VGQIQPLQELEEQRVLTPLLTLQLVALMEPLLVMVVEVEAAIATLPQVTKHQMEAMVAVLERVEVGVAHVKVLMSPVNSEVMVAMVAPA
jgi:hypothetical protein